MKSRAPTQKQMEFDVQFIKQFLVLAPIVKMQAGSPALASVTTYLKQYFGEKGKFERLVRLDARIRESGFNFRLTYDEIIDYTELLFVQNAYIVDNYSALVAKAPQQIEALSSYLFYAADLTSECIATLREAVYQLISTESDYERAEIALGRYTKQISHSYKAADVIISRLELFLKIYRTKYNVQIVSDEWIFYLYTSQIDLQVWCSQLLPELKNANLKALGVDTVLDKLIQCRDQNPDNPQYAIIVLTYLAKRANNIHKKPAEALEYLAEAQALREQSATEGRLSADMNNTLKYGMKVHQLKYSVDLACINPVDNAEALEKAL